MLLQRTLHDHIFENRKDLTLPVTMAYGALRTRPPLLLLKILTSSCILLLCASSLAPVARKVIQRAHGQIRRVPRNFDHYEWSKLT
jgi:hypothetical protein